MRFPKKKYKARGKKITENKTWVKTKTRNEKHSER